MDAPEREMRDDTVIALKAWRASKVLALDETKFARILEDIRSSTNAELWLAIFPPKAPAKKKKIADPLAEEVKIALAKYKATASTKAERLVRYMLPDRATMPKTMPAALKLLRAYFSDAEIVDGARALMKQLGVEAGTDVPL
jgi:hypothetical protein